MKNIVFLSAVTSLIGASVVSLNMFFFQLSLFRSLIIIISIAMLVELLVVNKKIQIKASENNFSIKFMFIWFIYALFTLAWVQDYVAWIKSIYFLGLGLLCIIIMVKYLRSENDILKIFRLLSIAIVFHNLIGWYEINTGNYLFLVDLRISRYIRGGFPVSMFGNTNDFAIFMMFSVFILYICMMNSQRIAIKIAYVLTILSSIVLLVMTTSRASMLGLIIGFIIFTMNSIKKRNTRRIVLISLLGIFILIFLYPNVVINLFQNINDNLTFNFSQQSGSDYVRTNLIRNGLVFLASTLGFGTGAGNIEYWMENYSVYNTGGILNIHNWWMEIMVGYGVIVFVLYIIFYTKLYLTLAKKFKYSSDIQNSSISIGIMSMMGGYIIASIGSSSNISSEWLWMFWGVAISYQGIPYIKRAG